MDIDIAHTTDAAMPYITALAAAYGKDTLTKVQDMAADRTSTATVALGRQLLNRLLRRDQSRDMIEGAVQDVAAEEVDSEAALRLQVRKALKADPELAREISGMLSASAAHVESSGGGSIAGNVNSGIASTGASALNVGAQHNHGTGVFIGRDLQISRDEQNSAES